LRGIEKDLEKLGNFAIVGQGNVAQANDFDRTHGKGMRSLVDSERKSYRALGFVRSRTAVVHPLSIIRGIRNTAQGYIQTDVQGDGFQMGGTLVLAAGGSPVYFQRSAFPGDHPPLKEVLDAMKAAAAASKG
jgi:hypothetical protein